MKLLGFQASLDSQLTTLITHDDVRRTILEIHYVKPIIFLRQSTNYSQKIVPLLISSLLFGIERAETALSLKKCKTKSKL